MILTQDAPGSRDFYVKHFPFDVTFDAGWYVSPKAKQVISPSHEYAKQYTKAAREQ